MKLELSRFLPMLGLALALGGVHLPAAAQAPQNLARTATATASSSWEQHRDPPNPTYLAGKINDGDNVTRWNAWGGIANDPTQPADVDGSWVALTWQNPVTFNKVDIDESFNRVVTFQLQVPEGTDWRTIHDSTGTNINPSGSQTPTYSVAFTTPVTTTALRMLIVDATTTASLREVRVYNTPLATITGTVTDQSTSQPIEGATVVIGNTSTATDAQGKYTLILEPGTVNVTVSRPGAYRARTSRNVALTANQTTTQNVQLIPQPNLLRTATAEGSSEYDPNYSPAKVNDGNLSSRWNSGANETDGAWISFMWATEQEFNSVKILEHLQRIADFTLQTWNETQMDWVDLQNRMATTSTANNAPNRWHEFNFTANNIRTKGIRVLINDAINLPTIFEIEVNKVPFGTVKGVVKDVATGNPVPNATVELNPGSSVTTDEQGAFTTVVGSDEYLVRATAPNYFESESQVVTVNANATANVTINLPPTGPNLATTATPSASSELTDTNPVANIKDADTATYWRAGLNEETGAPLSIDQWVALTWEQPVTFNVLNLNWGDGRYPVVQRSRFQTQDAGGQWVDIPNTEFSPEIYHISGQPARFIFNQPITTKAVRYFMNLTNGVETPPEVGEFQVFNSPIGGGGTPTVCRGDVDGDKALTVGDAVRILQHVVGLNVLTGAALTSAQQVNAAGDTTVDVSDAVKLLQVVVGLATDIPAACP